MNIEAPEWAAAGLAEADRLAEILLAEHLYGGKSWTQDNVLWELKVTTDYISTVEAEGKHDQEQVGYTFARTDSGWRVVELAER